jgi:sugar-specific transcriptional regulator TrmB
MTVIEVKKKKARSYIEQLMKKFVSNQNCLGLLRFFAAHPNGRFSKLAIIHAIDDDCNRIEMSQALDEMVEEKILDVTPESGVIYYVLTREEALRRLVMNMAIFEWSDWQLVLEHA